MWGTPCEACLGGVQRMLVDGDELIRSVPLLLMATKRR